MALMSSKKQLSPSSELPGSFAPSLSIKFCLDSCCTNKVRAPATLSQAFWNSASWEKPRKREEQQGYVPHCPPHSGTMHRHLSAQMSDSGMDPVQGCGAYKLRVWHASASSQLEQVLEALASQF